MMDRSWMAKHILSKEYKEGVNEFIKHVKSSEDDLDFIRCPCNECENIYRLSLDDVKFHLTTIGIDPRYTIWTWHGEVDHNEMSSSEDTYAPIYEDYDMDTLNDVADTLEMFDAGKENDVVGDDDQKFQAFLMSQLEAERKRIKELENILKEVEAQGNLPIQVRNSQSSEKVASITKISCNMEYVKPSTSQLGSDGIKSPSHCSKLKTNRKLRVQKLVSSPALNIGKGKECKLAFGKKDNIIAEEMVFEKNLGSQLKELIPEQQEENTDVNGNVHSEKNDDIGIIDAFSDMVETMVENIIRIPLEREIFGGDIECYASKKALMDVCLMRSLDVNIITAYIRLLYDKFSSSWDLVKFFNPSTISRASKNELSNLVRKRLQNAKRNQTCFIPFNIKGLHWVLIVVDLSTLAVYWLDSKMFNPSGSLKLYLNTGLNTTYIGGKRPMEKASWKIIKCPKQEGGVECGYFIMKFMRELMEDSSMSIETKLKKLSAKPTYTKDEVDEVRTEFIEFIVEHMNT